MLNVHLVLSMSSYQNLIYIIEKVIILHVRPVSGLSLSVIAKLFSEEICEDVRDDSDRVDRHVAGGGRGQQSGASQLRGPHHQVDQVVQSRPGYSQQKYSNKIPF